LKSISITILTLLMLGLVGFTIVSNDNDISDTPALTEEFAPVPERINISTSIIQYKDRGTMSASWYGPRFDGKTTANGEIFDQTAFTVAHKSIPFGTLLRITNPRNEKSVIVRVNDRGPYIPGRQIDLSKAVAEELDVINNGVKKLKIEELIISGIDIPIVSSH